MRVIICGDRYWMDKSMIQRYINTLPPEAVIIQGTARGADKIALDFARLKGHNVMGYHADWNKYGRAAGPIRNKRMIVEGKPDLVVAFHNNIEESKGTKDMLKQAKEHGIPTELHTSRGKAK